MAKAVNNDPTPSSRYERKFLVSGLTADEVASLIRFHPAVFSEIYHPRFVNSLYLDSPDLRNYFDNVDGIKNRVKVRIRWYGDLFGQVERPVLEVKIKHHALGRKATYPLTSFSVNHDFSFEAIRQVFQSSSLPETLKLDLLGLEGVFVGRYRRTYYQSACRHYRLTLDRDLEFYRLGFNNSFLHKSVDFVHPVLELKYDQGQDKDADRIVSYFPFRLTRISKYVLGVESLNLW
jgi:hypothetical protein